MRSLVESGWIPLGQHSITASLYIYSKKHTYIVLLLSKKNCVVCC